MNILGCALLAALAGVAVYVGHHVVDEARGASYLEVRCHKALLLCRGEV